MPIKNYPTRVLADKKFSYYDAQLEAYELRAKQGQEMAKKHALEIVVISAVIALMMGLFELLKLL